MKNLQKGFAIPLIIAIIAIIAIGGGVYVYQNNKVETPASTDVQVQQSNQVQQPTGQNNPVNSNLSTIPRKTCVKIS